VTHIVIHDDGAGQTQYCEFDDLGNAVAYLEEQRNSAGVDNAKLYELSEVRFEVRPYYRVEVVSGPATTAAAPVTPLAETEVDSPPADVGVDSFGFDSPPVDFAHFGASEIGEPAESSAVGADGRRGLFGR